MTTTVVNRRHGTPYDTYVGRPSVYGNPFSHLPNAAVDYIVPTREEAVECYRSYLITKLAHEPDFLDPIRGKVLACWCKPPEGFQGRVLCHAQVMAAYADGIDPEDVE